MSKQKNNTVDVASGESYYVLFTIDGKSSMVEAVFTGKSIKDLDNTINYLFRHPQTNKLYAFTMAQLSTFAGINDTDNADSHTSISVPV